MLQELESAKPAAEGSEEDGKRKSTDNSGQGKKKKRKTGGGIGFKPMAQKVAAKWKALNRHALAHYEELAAHDLQRYKTAMNEWREKKRLSGKVSPKDDLDEEEDDDEL